MTYFFNEFLYKPLFNILIFLYQYFSFHDLGISIILLTILIRLILFPLFYKSAKDQIIIQRLVPKIKKIQGDYKNNKEEQAKALLNLYREHNINPFSGFFLLLLQLPILIALYQVFFYGLSSNSNLSLIYSFLKKPDFLNYYFLGLLDLSKNNIILTFSAAMAQFFQGKLALVKIKHIDNNDKENLMPTEIMGRQMVYLGPIIAFLFLVNMPSALALYWLTTSLFSIIQQIIINKSVNL
jgi:YidC/Oxa1 family membrane protein insertase